MQLSTRFPLLRPAVALGLCVLGLAAAPAQTATRRPATSSNTNRSASSNRSSGGLSSGSGNYPYPNATQLGGATISSEADTHRIIVVADDATNAAIQKVIENLDRPKPQVLINVVFLQITHNNDLSLGTQFNYTGSILGGHTTENLLTQFGLVPSSNGAFYTVAAPNINATIQALSTIGKTEILSRPSILARSSQQATIMVGQEVPFITNSRISDTGQTTNTVQYQDIGIILRVTPYITDQGLVQMIITPEISALSSQTVPISDTVSSPVIDKRSADTVVVTPSDRTVVIGGLISDQTTDQNKQVPLLGDIPLLGVLFKYKTKSTAKTELMIFLTPHVVPQPEGLSGMTDQERARLQLKPEYIKPASIDRLIKSP